MSNGSGVIPNRFEEFILSEEKDVDNVINFEPLMEAIDYDKIYEDLVASIMESSFGGMLQMMGGEEALIPLREPFTNKMKLSLIEMVASDRFKTALEHSLNAHKIGEDTIGKVETVIDKHLNELTPQLVKEMVQQIIRQHLGWLVVCLEELWGLALALRKL